MLRFFLSLLLMGITPALMAQSNYKKAYMVNIENDTIHGYINFRNWDKNPEFIEFKAQLNAQSEVLGLTDIQSFWVEDRKYMASEILVELSPFQLDELNTDPELSFEKKKVFLNVLIDGPKKLYLYRERSGKDHYYIDKKGIPILLVHKRYLKEYDQNSSSTFSNSKTILQNKSFLTQLRTYFSDWPEVNSKLKNIEYEKHHLIKLFKRYYKQSPSNKINLAPQAKFKHYFGVTIGAGTSTMKIWKGEYPLEETQKHFHIIPTVGISSNLVLPIGLGQWNWRNELHYSSYEIENDYMHQQFVRIDYKKYKFRTNHIKLNSSFRYHHTLPKVKLIAGLGMSAAYNINPKAQVNNISQYGDYVYGEESVANLQTKKGEQGLMLDLGAYFGKFGMNFRGEFTNGLSTSRDGYTQISRYFLMLSYDFQ